MRILPLLSVLALSCSSAGAAVIVGAHLTDVSVYQDEDGSWDYMETEETDIPQNVTVIASATDAFARLNLDWSTTGLTTTFSYQGSHTLSAGAESGAEYTSQFAFLVTTDATYSIAGNSFTSSLTGESFYSEYQGILIDFTAGEVLWSYGAFQDGTSPTMFEFNNPPVDPDNEGSLTGSLVAGHIYLYGAHFYGEGPSVDGTSHFSLQITETGTVPDAGATVVLFGGALAGLVALRRFVK